MKKNIGLTCMLAWMFIAGCIDDRGNYDCQQTSDVWPVVISGLESEYDRVIGDQLKLTATVEGAENMENLKYTWFLHVKGLAFSQEDTLSRGKELDWHIAREAGTYNLVFEVRDTVRDLFTKSTVVLRLSTRFSTGWFVLETDGTGTDMDMITPEGTTSENLLTSFGSSRLEGNPRKLVYKQDHRHEVENADGTVEIVKRDAFILTSERDIRVYDAETIGLLKDRETCFYEMPTPVNPLNRFVNSITDDQLNNNGQFYMTPAGSVGKFGYPLLGPDGTDNYDAHADGLFGGQVAFLWDKISRSFLYATTASEMSFLNGPTAGTTDFGAVTKTDKELIRMLFRSYEYVNKVGIYYAYVLWKDTDGKYTIADMNFNKATYPIVGVYSLPQGNLITGTEMMEAHQKLPKIFFPANGNELWEHSVSSKTELAERERKVYSFPGGEKIACIRHLYVDSKNVNEPMDRLVVLTNSAEGWKLYGFEFIGGGSEFDMTATPGEALIGKGKGEAGYVMRMDRDKAY